jgi:hypothetical protein
MVDGDSTGEHWLARQAQNRPVETMEGGQYQRGGVFMAQGWRWQPVVVLCF